MNSKKPKEEIRKKKQFKIDSFVSLKIIKNFYQFMLKFFLNHQLKNVNKNKN